MAWVDVTSQVFQLISSGGKHKALVSTEPSAHKKHLKYQPDFLQHGLSGQESGVDFEIFSFV